LIIPKWHPTHLHVLHLHVTLCIERTCKHLAILLSKKDVMNFSMLKILLL
jgi:hypothetical protein